MISPTVATTAQNVIPDRTDASQSFDIAVPARIARDATIATVTVTVDDPALKLYSGVNRSIPRIVDCDSSPTDTRLNSPNSAPNAISWYSMFALIVFGFCYLSDMRDSDRFRQVPQSA